jgi:hypothetical protein
MKATVKHPEYPYHPWLVNMAGTVIEVELRDDGYYYQIRADGNLGFIFSASELVFKENAPATS